MSAMTMKTRPSTVSSVHPSMMPLVDNDFDLTVEDMLDTFGTDRSGSALVAETTEHYRYVPAILCLLLVSASLFVWDCNCMINRCPCMTVSKAAIGNLGASYESFSRLEANIVNAVLSATCRRFMQPSAVHAQGGGSDRHVSKQVMAGHGDRVDTTPPSWPCPNLIPLHPPLPSQEDDNSFLNWDADIDGGIRGDGALFGGTSVDSLLGDFLGEAQGMTEILDDLNDDQDQILNAQQLQSVLCKQVIGPEVGKPRRRIEASISPSSSHGPRRCEGEAQLSHSGSATSCQLAHSPSPLPFFDIDTTPWAGSLPPDNPDFLDAWMDHMTAPSNSNPVGNDTTLVRFGSESSLHEDCRCVDSQLLPMGHSEGTFEDSRHQKVGSESGWLDPRSTGKLLTVTDGASRPVDMSARLAALVGSLVPKELSRRAVLPSSLSTSTTRPLPATHRYRALALRAGKGGRMRAPRLSRLVALDGTLLPSSVMKPPAAPCPSRDLMLARGAVRALQRDMPAEQMGVQLVAYAEAMATDDQVKTTEGGGEGHAWRRMQKRERGMEGLGVGGWGWGWGAICTCVRIRISVSFVLCPSDCGSWFRPRPVSSTACSIATRTPPASPCRRCSSTSCKPCTRGQRARGASGTRSRTEDQERWVWGSDTVSVSPSHHTASPSPLLLFSSSPLLVPGTDAAIQLHHTAPFQPTSPFVHSIGGATQHALFRSLLGTMTFHVHTHSSCPLLFPATHPLQGISLYCFLGICRRCWKGSRSAAQPCPISPSAKW